MKYQCAQVIALIGMLGLLVVANASAQTADDKSLDEVNKQLSNPISSIWALQLQQNTYWLDKPDRNLVNLQFQPVLPIALTDDWNLISRPVLQVMNSTPYVNSSGNLHRVTGFGDHHTRDDAFAQCEAGRPLALGAGPDWSSPLQVSQ